MLHFKKNTRWTTVLLSVLLIILTAGFSTNHTAEDKQYNISIPDNRSASVSLVSYGVYGIENFMGKDRLNTYIEFQNNTELNIHLIYFSFDGYDKNSKSVISSQNNTNNIDDKILPNDTVSVNLKFPTDLATVKLKIEKYITSDGNEHLVSDDN